MKCEKTDRWKIQTADPLAFNRPAASLHGIAAAYSKGDTENAFAAASRFE